MSEQTIELKEMEQKANEAAKNTSIEMVANVLVNACNGKKCEVAGVPGEMVTDQPPSESDSPARGLILSEENIINIKRYVDFGLKLATDMDGVRTQLNYSSDFDKEKYPQVAPEAFVKLHSTIRNHCCQWSDLEQSIKTQGTSLNIFGLSFVQTGDEILKLINAMPVLDRVRTKLGELRTDESFTFDADDVALQGSIVELLREIKEKAKERQERAHQLAGRLEEYRRTMENDVVPQVGSMNTVLTDMEGSKEREKLLKKREDLDKEIQALDKEYKEMVGYAFTGASGLLLGPIGIISWAITGGIFGDKAEKARKLRASKGKELEHISRQLEAEEHLAAFVSSTHDQVTKQDLIIAEAVSGVKNLEVMWASVVQYVDEAVGEMDKINESEHLILFTHRLTGAVNSWKEVRDITGELVALFESAAKRAKEMGLKEA